MRRMMRQAGVVALAGWLGLLTGCTELGLVLVNLLAPPAPPCGDLLPIEVSTEERPAYRLTILRGRRQIFQEINGIAIGPGGQVIGTGPTEDPQLGSFVVSPFVLGTFAVDFPCSTGFVFDGQQVQALPTRRANEVTTPIDINGSGLIVGTARSRPVNEFFFRFELRPVVIEGDQLLELPVPAGVLMASPSAVNEAGTIVGIGGRQNPPSQNVAVLWRRKPAGGWKAETLDLEGGISDLNDAEQIVGVVPSFRDDGRFVQQPFVWQGGVLRMLPTLAGPSALAAAINNAGQIVGWAEPQEVPLSEVPPRSAVLWDGDSIVELPPLPDADDSEATDINDDGWIVGASGPKGPPFVPRHAVLWRDGQVFDLNEQIGNPSDLLLTEAVSINNAGQILATGETFASDPPPTGMSVADVLNAVATGDPEAEQVELARVVVILTPTTP